MLRVSPPTEQVEAEPVGGPQKPNLEDAVGHHMLLPVTGDGAGVAHESSEDKAVSAEADGDLTDKGGQQDDVEGDYIQPAGYPQGA